MGTVLRTLAVSLAIFIAGVSARAGERLDPVHIVFDIDWTLTSTIPESDVLAAYAHDPRFLQVDGKYYRLSNGVDEAINRLLDFNRKLGYEYVKISFFSGGSRKRNESLLKNIILDRKTGKSAFDVAERILSFEDLKDLSPGLAPGTELRFADRYQKNLLTAFKDLERTIAIDDTEKFFRGDQTKSLLWIGETYTYFPTYADVVLARHSHPELKYLPPNFEAWITDQNRILIAGLQVEYSLQAELDAAAAGSPPIPFRDRIQAISAKYSKLELYSQLRQTFPERYLRDCRANLLPPLAPAH